KELIAIILGSGTKDESVMTLSNRVLMHFEGLRLLNDATIEELTAIKGIGPAKGVMILAAIELGRRISSLKLTRHVSIRSPQDGADYVMEDMRTLNQEHFVALFLNTKNEVIHHQTIFIGSLNTSVVHQSEVFREAVKHSAVYIICVQSHPTDDPTHYQEDIHFTRRLVDAGKMIGITILDNIIIGDRKFVSLKEKGYL